MASHFHILRYIASFVDQATMYPAWSPACFVTKELKLLETEWDTHTHKRPVSNMEDPNTLIAERQLLTHGLKNCQLAELTQSRNEDYSDYSG